MKFLILILFFALPEWISGSVLPGDTSRLRLVFAGDMMGHDEQIFSAWDDVSKTYNYDTCFSMIRDYISSADIAFVNLEVTLAGPPYKGYPQFSSPDELATAAARSGFDVFLTANNHSLDRGKKGLERTITILDSIGIIHTGIFTDMAQRDERYPLVIEKNNVRLAILNYTYGTNGIKVSEPNIINYIDTSEIASDLAKAELADPDFIIVTIHWGSEYQRTENKEQTELAGYIFKNGADIIIGSHPHVIQPVRKYYPSPYDPSDCRIVVYSLGNFISNQRERYRNGGLIFGLELEKTGNTKVTAYDVYPVYVHKTYTGNRVRHFVLLPANDFDTMVETHSMSPEEKDKFRIFKEDTEEIFLDDEMLKVGWRR